MNRTAKAAAAAAVIATITGWAATTAANTINQAQARQEARAAEARASVKLCQEARGRWYTAQNGAPRCNTEATVTTREADPDRPCQGHTRREAGIELCDEAK